MISLDVERIRRELRAEYGHEPDHDEPARVALARAVQRLHDAMSCNASLDELLKEHRAVGTALSAFGGEAVGVIPRRH